MATNSFEFVDRVASDSDILDGINNSDLQTYHRTDNDKIQVPLEYYWKTKNKNKNCNTPISTPTRTPISTPTRTPISTPTYNTYSNIDTTTIFNTNDTNNQPDSQLNNYSYNKCYYINNSDSDTTHFNYSDTNTCYYINNIDINDTNNQTDSQLNNYSYNTCCYINNSNSDTASFNYPDTNTCYYINNSDSYSDSDINNSNAYSYTDTNSNYYTCCEAITLNNWKLCQYYSNNSDLPKYYIDGQLQNGRYRETSTILKLTMNPKFLDILTINGGIYRLYYESMASNGTTNYFNMTSCNSIYFPPFTYEE